jgi:hypothetical protein
MGFDAFFFTISSIASLLLQCTFSFIIQVTLYVLLFVCCQHGVQELKGHFFGPIVEEQPFVERTVAARLRELGADAAEVLHNIVVVVLHHA